MNKKLNFKEFNINVSYEYIFQCVKEIYECFTVNNNNLTNFKEFIYCPSI